MSLYIKTQKFLYPLPIFGKLFTAFALFLAAFATISGQCCEKHESKHQITYGEPEEKLAVTQHFSLGSPEILRFIKEEFLALKEEFITTGLASWTFCPHVADVTTMQLIVCLELLSEVQRTQFFDQVLLELNPRTFDKAPQRFLKNLEKLSLSPQEIEFPQLLKIGEFFERGGEFLDQKVFANPPSHIEIGNQVFDYLIHPSAIRYQIEQQL
jgi:hypothetical protein